VLGEIRKLLPFPLLGFDTDNDAGPWGFGAQIG